VYCTKKYLVRLSVSLVCHPRYMVYFIVSDGFYDSNYLLLFFVISIFLGFIFFVLIFLSNFVLIFVFYYIFVLFSIIIVFYNRNRRIKIIAEIAFREDVKSLRLITMGPNLEINEEFDMEDDVGFITFKLFIKK